MHDLGQVGVHALAQSGGQHDDVERSRHRRIIA
jgi:hypothetical protein